jgi:hypothetical protein
MAPDDDIDTILADLRKEVGNVLTLINIVIALRRNSAHLLELLRSMMVDLCEEIERTLPRLQGEGERDA